MASVESVKILKAEMSVLNDVIDSYEEISAMQTRKTRRKVLSLRDFLKGLNEVYGYTYVSLKRYRATKSSISSEKSAKTSNKTLCVLLSSNTGLYGDIVRQAFEIFRSYVSSRGGDYLIVGKVGRVFFEKEFPDREFIYRDLSDYSSIPSQMSEIYNVVSSYENIIVFHGYFDNVLKQIPVMSNVLGELEKIETELSTESKNMNFLYEPSIENVYTYFRNQISLLLVDQSILESSLSKFASRMINLEEASVRIKSSLQKFDNYLLRKDHKRINRNLVNNLHAVEIWK